MSYILDALRKSESERQRETASGIARAPMAASRQHMPGWAWALIVLLTLALAGLAVAWWRSGLIAPATAPAASSDSVPTAAPIADQPPATGRADVIGPALPTDLTPEPISRIRDLDANLPSYRLEFVAYNGDDPAQSSVWINGSRYFAGERIAGGPELVEIRVDSVILGFRSRRFLLTTR